MYDVAIIGCGIVGAATAFALSRYHLSLVLVEKENDVAAGTTKANSAIIHAGFDPEPGTLMAALNVQGNTLVRELCGILDVPYKQCGSLVLAFSRKDEEILMELLTRGRANGVPGLAILDKACLREIEPGASPKATAALYAPSTGIVCPWELTLALTECAMENGADLLLEHEVTGIKRVTDGYCLETEKGSIEAKRILNAAGVYADKIHNMAAAPSFRIIPDRGVYYLLDKKENGRVSHVVFQCPDKQGKGTLVAPTVHGNLIVGPNNEPPRYPDDTATTAEGLVSVARKARRIVPGVDLRENIRTFAGVRAATDKSDFIIGEADGAPGFIDAAGIKSPGLTAAPAIAEMVVGIFQKGGLVLTEKADFTCGRKRLRFAELSPAEKAQAVVTDSSYGRVVCRCGTVTEGEVLAAMRGLIPPRSLDGVKRRTGAGLGRCQGGFCGPRVAELLMREAGISPAETIQDRRGSYLLTGETKSSPEMTLQTTNRR